METMSIHLMNTDFYIAVPTSDDLNWKREIESWLVYVAEEWSRFREDNELARLNVLKIGETMQLSESLYDCLTKAHYYYELTGGLFSPYLKKQMEQNGYDTSFPFTHSTSESIGTEFVSESPFLFLDDKRIMKKSNQEVDLGGFAKGYAVEMAGEWLKENGFSEYGIVDGGGDMTMWSDGEKEWTIGIEDPYQPGHEIGSIKLKNGSVATSNRIFRSWMQGNEKKHHLLNGLTGKSANTNIIQATVVTSSLIQAEVATKMCFLLNEEQQSTWFSENFPKTASFLVNEKQEGYWMKLGEDK